MGFHLQVKSNCYRGGASIFMVAKAKIFQEICIWNISTVFSKTVHVD
jgi:hypothetical protein